jgi:tetratricopeptide (TPR) repeat protein
MPEAESSAGMIPKVQVHWMFGPLQDGLLVLLTPLVILAAFSAALLGAWTDGLVAFGLVLSVGHYLPGVLRAYGDRALFQRFRLRLILAPLFFVAISALFAYQDLHIILLIAMIWGAWHWMMQIYGFARIYDAKQKVAAVPRYMDLLLCMLWFGMCVFVLNNDLPRYVEKFYESGGPFVRSAVFSQFTGAWAAVTVVVTIAYVFYTISAMRAGRSPNPLKLIFLIVTFAYLAHTSSMIDRPTAGFVMFESWHDIQYLTIVWFFSLNRTRNDPAARSFFRFLFRPGAVLVLVYVAVCLMFGSLAHAWKLFENQALSRLAASVVTSAALLHYYLDGFIWKIRESDTREALGVEAVPDVKMVTRRVIAFPAWARHSAIWLLFVVPVLFFPTLESRPLSRLQRVENMVDSFPNSPVSHYELGKLLQDMGRRREAKTHFDKALALDADFQSARVSLGILLAEQGDLSGGRVELERVLEVEANDAEAHNNLGVILEEQGDLSSAARHMELATRLHPGDALFHNNLARVRAALGASESARAELELALRLDPEFADAHYQLGSLLVRQGHLQDAVGQFKRAVAIDSGLSEAHYELGQVLAKLGSIDEAIDSFQRAITVDPEPFLAHEALGNILMNQNRMAEAKAHFEEALRIKPDFSAALAGLGQATKLLGTARRP